LDVVSILHHLEGAKTLIGSRFNKIGNREMYMNCAPVNIVPKGSRSKSKRESGWETLEARDVQKVNTAAQSALSSYPSLFVANLKSVNDCVTKETQDVVFDAPGKDVAFADGKSRSVAASFGDGKCTGKGGDSAGSSSSSSSLPPPPGNNGQWTGGSQSQPSSSQISSSSSSSGNNGQWNGGSQSQPSSSKSSSSSSCANANDGQYHPECYGGQKATDITTGKPPAPKVEKALDEYLSGLYVDFKTKRTVCSEVKREPCASPYRWVKRDACTWTCERRGRRAQLTPSTTTAPTAKAADLESELRNIEATISQLMDLASKEQHIVRRESNNATNTANSTLSAEPEPSDTFDMFLTYLSRLQTNVVECIRNIAAVTPSGSPVPVVDIVASTPNMDMNMDMSTSEMIKRQLVVPNLAEMIGAMKIDSNDPLYAALNDLGMALQKVGELVGEKVGGGDVNGGLSALMSAVDSASIPTTSTSPIFNVTNATNATNATENELQNAADLAAALSQDEKANTPLPSSTSPIFNATTSTENELQNAADLAAALSQDEKANTPPPSSSSVSSTITPTPTLDPSAAILPYLLGGPGPVIVKPGPVFSLPGPDAALPSGEVSNLETFPTVVDDLGPGAEEEIRKFFEGLNDGDDGN
jgi:hypothetical protein